MAYADPEIFLAKRLGERLSVKTWADPRLPERWDYTAPLVHVQRAGSDEAAPTLDAPLMDIDVYAALVDNAREVAELVRAEVRLHLPQFTDQSGATITATRTVTAPMWLPDPNVFRRTATYQLFIHAAL